ncbi:MAG: discoidin domain-containing protein [Planctomycetota bacterium]
MSYRRVCTVLLFCFVAFSSPIRVNGEIVIDAGTIVGTNVATHAPGTAYSIEHAINQSGLSAGYTSGVTDFSSYFASNPTHAVSGVNTHFLGITNGGYVDFDLGQTYNLSSIAVWNWHNSQGNVGVTDIQVFKSNDDTFSTLSSIGDFDFSVNGSTTAQLRQFSIPTSARFIRLDIANSGFANRPGFGELAFGAVPEPSSFLMFALGFAGLAGRRRSIKGV